MPTNPRDLRGRFYVIRGGTWILSMPSRRIMFQIECANEDARSVSFRTHLASRRPLDKGETT